MSQEIRTYKGRNDYCLGVDALMGPDGDRDIIIKIGREKVRISERQVLDLISVLGKRLKCTEKSFQATGYGDTRMVRTDGHVELKDEVEEVEEEW